jgi:hypothetical protein
MLEHLPIDLAGHRPPTERTAAINTALAALEAAKPNPARPTTANLHARFLRQLIASFKPPPRDPASIPPLHGMERGLGGVVGRAPPVPVRA